MFCYNCGKEVNDKAVVCVHCGCAIKQDKVTEKSEKFIIALLLCLFLGNLGAHRFYTGHTISAVIMLILAISIVGLPIVSIWVFIDFICILTGSFKNADGKPLKR